VAAVLAMGGGALLRAVARTGSDLDGGSVRTSPGEAA
jgi:hypothetical protein